MNANQISVTFKSKSSTPSVKNSRLFWTISSIILAGVLFAVYAKSLNNGFVDWDDNRCIYDNIQIRQLSPESLKAIFVPAAQEVPELYIPLTFLSYQIEYFFFKLDPFYYHLDNLILHIFNTLLVFWLVHLWSKGKWPAFLAALLFGLHPTHPESVVWATERRDVLSTFFFLASLICYSKFLIKKTICMYGFCLATFLLSLFSKPMAVTLPVILLLMDYKARRPFDKSSLMEKIPFGILSLIFSLLTVHLQHGALESGIPFWKNIPFVIKTVVFYLGKFILPVRLSTMYSDPASWNISWNFAMYLVVFFAVATLVYVSRKWTREIVFGFSFFIVTLLPTFPATLPPLHFFAADRYLYLPSVGLLYIAVLGIAKVYSSNSGFPLQFKKAAILVAVGFVTLFFCWGSYHRSLAWKNSETVALDALRHYPRAVDAYAMLGTYYTERQMKDKAISSYKKALEIAPDHPQAYHMLGVMFTLLGQPDEAQTYFQKALSRGTGSKQTHYNMAVLYKKKGQYQDALSELQKALAASPDDPLLYHELGIIYKALGDKNQAIESFQKAIRMRPDSEDAHNELGVLYTETGRLPEAIAEYQRAIALKPSYALAYSNLGIIYLRLGRSDEALENCLKAAKLDPTNAEIHNSLGAAYGTKGQLKEAAEEFKKATELKADYAGAYENLGIIYAEQGKTKEARKMFQKVLEINPNHAGAKSKLEQLGNR